MGKRQRPRSKPRHNKRAKKTEDVHPAAEPEEEDVVSLEDEPMADEEEYDSEEFNIEEDMDLQSDDIESEGDEEEEEQMKLDDLLEDISLDDFSDEEEGLEIKARKEKREKGDKKEEGEGEGEGEKLESKSKVDKVQKVLQRAEKKGTITVSTATKLLKLFKKVLSNSDDNQSYIGPQIYRLILSFSVQKLPGLIVKAVRFDKLKDELDIMADMKKIKLKNRHESLMRSYIANFLKLLKEDASPQTAIMYLSSIADIMKLSLPFKPYSKKLLQAIIPMVTDYFKMTEDCQLFAFTGILSILKWNTDEGLCEWTLKKFYSEYMKSVRAGSSGSHITRQNLRIAQNCFVELLSLNPVVSYQVGFQSIRKLCLHVRGVRNNLSKESMRKVINWQMYFGLQLWNTVITKYSDEEFQLLKFPFVQLCFACIGVSSKNSKYFPFTIKLCSMLNSLEGQFIPITQYLLHLFWGTDDFLNRKTKPIKGSLPDMEVAIRISKEHHKTTEMKDWVFRTLLDEITVYLGNHWNQAAFPEISLGIETSLRKFKKRCKNPGYCKMITALLQRIASSKELIEEKRFGKTISQSKYTFEPKTEIGQQKQKIFTKRAQQQMEGEKRQKHLDEERAKQAK